MQLVDTSAWIHWLRDNGDAKVGDAVDVALRSGNAAWCGMVQLELWNGARDGADQKRLRLLESVLPLLPITDKVWVEAHTCARQARVKGVTVPSSDILILACARVHEAELLHSDNDYASLQKALR